MISFGRNTATGEPVSLEFAETILSVTPLEMEPVEPGTESFEPDEVHVAPGFVDLQVNGFAGIDFNNPETSPAEIAGAVDALLSTGVTRFLPTVITGSPEAMLASLRNLRQAKEKLPRGHAIAGFHVEGPHISADDGPRGAHPSRWVRPPDLAEFSRWQEATQGNIRLVTLSPHWPEAPAYISEITKAGCAASIGHTNATTEQIAAAVDAGATLSTHLGNAARRELPKLSNCLWDQLAEDRLSASFIVDGFHLNESFLRVALRAKGVERSILVTDAAAAAGAAPGRYHLGGLDVDLTEDDRVVLAGTERLAGSALRIDRAVENVVRIGKLTLRDAVRTVTTNPARLIGLAGRGRGLEPGERGDIVVFRQAPGFQIQAVYLDGEKVA